MADDPKNAETLEESWFAKLWNSIKGFGLGFLLFVGSFYLLSWNEGRALRTYASLDEGLGAVVSIDSSEIHDNNNDKLVHLRGTATSDEQLTDEKFAISVNGLQLFRHVEMYQWQETVTDKVKQNPGGGQTSYKDYKYDAIWSSEPIDSSGFNPAGIEKKNPAKFPFDSKTITANKVQLGAFTLPSKMVEGIKNPAVVLVSKANIPTEFKGRMVVVGNRLFLGADPERPQVGDVRTSFPQTPATEITVVARQDDGSLSSYQTNAGDALLMLKEGKLNASQMFATAQTQNSFMTWFLRAVGILAMCGGLKLMLSPIAVVTDLIPIVGGVMQLGINLVCGVSGVSLSLLTIGLAWVSYRPLIGIPLLVVSAVAIFVLVKKRRRKMPSEGSMIAAPPVTPVG